MIKLVQPQITDLKYRKKLLKDKKRRPLSLACLHKSSKATFPLPKCL